MKTVMVSGGFDPLHVGHIGLFEAAAEHGRLIVVLNSDDWLMRKKGFTFQPWSDRATIISSIAYVSSVEAVDDSDGTVVSALECIMPDIFANGGDRTINNTPELEACKRLGITAIFGIGPGKATSSSLVAVRGHVEREWGSYDLIAEGEFFKVKRLIIAPGKRSKEQRHAGRSEFWFYPDLSHKHIPAGEWHRLENLSDDPLEVIEVQLGICSEDDIERRDA